MPKVYNKRDKNIPNGAVYVGRPSRFGNEFVIGVDGSRSEVVEKFKRRCLGDSAFQSDIRKALKGKDLVCWCAPEACHADVLLEIANEIS